MEDYDKLNWPSLSYGVDILLTFRSGNSQCFYCESGLELYRTIMQEHQLQNIISSLHFSFPHPRHVFNFGPPPVSTL